MIDWFVVALRVLAVFIGFGIFAWIFARALRWQNKKLGVEIGTGKK